ncbi:MAG: hypothetical protein EOP24_32545 [Hyphomicrobiales bacterium]|nr:MAG: hypothetical protein EOP24_32545 [Hyphomicrobiales bacterium]
MSKLVKEREIAEELLKISPTRIAVAFLGADWDKYIVEPEKIEQIVISPTLGSNPKAILHLSEKIGWDKIFFLDELHAKVYLGPNSGMVGSSNPTANGLCGEALREFAVVLESSDELNSIGEFLDETITLAEAMYSTEKKKKDRLAKLQNLWNEAFSRSLIEEPTEPPKTSINDFVLTSNKDFYVLWYEKITPEHSAKLKKIESLIVDEMHFSPKDEPEANRFVLVWKKTRDDKVDMRTWPYWLYIHEIISDGIVADDYEYTTVGIERSDLLTPPDPFELTDEVVARFREAINSGKLTETLIQQVDGFELSKAQDGLEILVKALRISDFSDKSNATKMPCQHL